MSGAVDVKSVCNGHIIRRVIDVSTVELMCGRIGTSTDEPSATPSGPVLPICGSCVAADRFERDR